MNAYPTWIDGHLHAPGEGRVSVCDTGFLLGLSVFESVLWEDGVAYFLEDHIDRRASVTTHRAIRTPSPRRYQTNLHDSVGEKTSEIIAPYAFFAHIGH